MPQNKVKLICQRVNARNKSKNAEKCVGIGSKDIFMGVNRKRSREIHSRPQLDKWSYFNFAVEEWKRSVVSEYLPSY